MIIDPNEYEISVCVISLRQRYKWEEIVKWLREQDIDTQFAYGNLYFCTKEEAALFTLKFEL